MIAILLKSFLVIIVLMSYSFAVFRLIGEYFANKYEAYYREEITKNPELRPDADMDISHFIPTTRIRNPFRSIYADSVRDDYENKRGEISLNQKETSAGEGGSDRLQNNYEDMNKIQLKNKVESARAEFTLLQTPSSCRKNEDCDGGLLSLMRNELRGGNTACNQEQRQTEWRENSRDNAENNGYDTACDVNS